MVVFVSYFKGDGVERGSDLEKPMEKSSRVSLYCCCFMLDDAHRGTRINSVLINVQPTIDFGVGKKAEIIRIYQ